jgi:hypothetical protein
MGRPRVAGPDAPEDVFLRKRHIMLIAMLAAGTATFLFAVLRRREQAPAPPYRRPEGGEREGEFELFIGS